MESLPFWQQVLRAGFMSAMEHMRAVQDMVQTAPAPLVRPGLRVVGSDGE